MTDRVVVVITGVPGAGKTTLARALSAALRLPLLSVDVVKETLFDTLGVRDREWSLHIREAALNVTWSMLLDCPSGAIVDMWIDPKRDADTARSARAVIDTSRVFEVVCDVPGELAAARYAARRRHPGHLPPDHATLSRMSRPRR